MPDTMAQKALKTEAAVAAPGRSKRRIRIIGLLVLVALIGVGGCRRH